MSHQAPIKPTLPQNDSPAEKAAREAQLAASRGVYGWTTGVKTLPGVPAVAALPASEEPTLEWWVMLTEIGIAIVRNHLAVKLAAIEAGLLALAPAEIAASRLVCDAIEADIAALKAKIAHNTSGGTLWHRLVEDVEMGALAFGEELLVAKFKDHAGKLFAIVELSDAEQQAYGTASPRTLETYRALFQTLPLPGIAWTFQDDAEFARLRVAGPNAVLIRQVAELPAKLPLTAAAYAAVVNGDTLAAALDEGRLYLCDYAALETIVPGQWQGTDKFIARPLALFAVPPGGFSLTPVAIQCGQDPSENPIFTPSPAKDAEWGWELAKLCVQVADGNYHELFAHLAHTHLVIEAVTVATRRHLAEQHPLWALLVPHCEGTLFINNAAATSLITAGGPIDHIFAGTIQSSQATAVAARLGFDFTRRMLPNDLVERGVADTAQLPDYPYRDDALLVWHAIHGWAKDYVALYYASDADVTGDTELQAWTATLAGEGSIAGFPAIATRATLADVCTMIVFTASAQHAAVNFPQRTVMEFAPAVTGSLWQPAPDATTGQRRTDWLAAMPPVAPALQQLETLALLGSLYYRPLGTYQSRYFPYPAWFQDPAVTGPEGPLPRFQAALREVEVKIAARNAERRVSYPYLLPSQIPTSTNI